MTDPNDRHYSEEEVRAIFQETARRQSALQAASSPGLTLEELQEVARNAGLDPELVAAAAAHLHEPVAPASRFWNLPDVVRDERVIPGEVTDQLWEQIVDELRRTFGHSGQAGQIGRIREWSFTETGSPGPVHVEVRPEGEQTRMVLTQSLAAHRKAALTATPTIAALGILMPFVALAAGGLAQWPVMLLIFLVHFLIASGVAVGTHRAANVQHRRQRERFEKVLDRVDLLALRGGADRVVPAPQTSPRLPLGSDTGDEYGEEAASIPVGRRQRGRR
jgi:hypothetical protein